MRRLRGFSMLELSIALAIAGVVVAAAASSAVMVTRVLKLDGKKSAADQDSRRLVDYILTRMQGVGGGPVRPWMALWLEQDCGARDGMVDCNWDYSTTGGGSGQSDRLTLVDVDVARVSCGIDAMTGTTISFSAVCRDPSPPANLDACIDVACCYDWVGSPEPGSPPNQYADQAVMLVKGRSQWIAHKVGTEVQNITGAPSDIGNCTLTLDTAYNPLGDWGTSLGDNGSVTAVSGNNYVDGSAAPVVIRSLYINDTPTTAVHGTTRPSLLEWTDTNLNGSVDAGEERVVFPGVQDFQVALGFDALPEDGRIVELSTNADEWFGTVVSDGIPTGIEMSQLRMARVGIVVSVPAVDGGVRSVQVLNGDPITTNKTILRRAVGEAMLRNIAVFY